MKIIKPHTKEIVFHVPEGYTMETWIERVGRVAYKSEDKITEKSAPKFIKMLTKRCHWAVIEHCIVSAHIIADRGLLAELTRHRIASFCAESTRMCNYSKGKFNSEITVIEQPTIRIELKDGEIELPEESLVWLSAIETAEHFYIKLLELGIKPEIARSVLPIGLKAEIIITANLREWHTIFGLRCDTPAHPIIRGVMLEILNKFNDRLSSIYNKQAERFLNKN